MFQLDILKIESIESDHLGIGVFDCFIDRLAWQPHFSHLFGERPLASFAQRLRPSQLQTNGKTARKK
jgi:hypothetical protein